MIYINCDDDEITKEEFDAQLELMSDEEVENLVYNEEAGVSRILAF